MLTSYSYSAGTSGSGGSDASSSNYDKASSLIKRAKKLEKKGKIEKAKLRFNKALEYLIVANYKRTKRFIKSNPISDDRQVTTPGQATPSSTAWDYH